MAVARGKAIRIGALCLLYLLAGAGMGWAAEIAVVVHPSLSVTDLDVAEVRRIYMGEKDFVNGVPVHPVDYQGRRRLRDDFLGVTVGMSCRAFDAYWIKEVFRSGHFPPVKVDGFQAMIDAVAASPGAIGYVPVEHLRDVTGVRRVLVLQVP